MAQQTAQSNRSQQVLRKSILVMFGIGVFGMLWWRLWQLQIFEGERFLKAAESNRFYSLTVPAPRGVFFDRYGNQLTINQKQYYLVDNPQQLYSNRVAISSQDALQYLATDSAKVVAEYQRNYPAGSSLSHLLGYLAPVTADDLEADSKLAANDQIGKLGLEQAYQTRLAGGEGTLVVEINAQAEKLRIVSQTEPVAGESFETNIDSALAAVSSELLAGKKGSLIVLDADTGAVLSLVNSPQFDPNLFTRNTRDNPEAEQLRQEAITLLLQDSDQPFFNRGITGLYPPGSIFKLVTALAGLETEAVTAQTTVLDEGVLRVGDFEYRNWLYRQYGQTDGEIALERALARSNDIYFYKAAEWIGPSRLANIASLLGLGTPTGIEIGAEGSGTIPSPAWKEQVIGEPWYLGNTYHFGIGQGDVLVTPLQLASMVQALANAGTHCQPSLLAASLEDSSRCQEVGILEEHIDLVLSGMIAACSPGGTGFPFFQRNAQLVAVPTEESAEAQNQPQETDNMTLLKQGAVACKTGTAEFGSRNEDGFRPTHGWFVAVVEPQITNPDREVSVEARIENTDAAQNQVFTQESHQAWVQAHSKKAFPERLVILALVESDQNKQYREGSSDAAPLVDGLLTWIENGTLPDEVETEIEADSATIAE